MQIELESMAIEMPKVAGHPNREPFRGVLTLVDVPSDRSPAGARGHRVVLTRAAAEAALPSLLGMGLDYAPTLDRHDTRRKVGVITGAEIVGRTLELSGHLFAKDFPEVVEAIRQNPGRARTLAATWTPTSRKTGETWGTQPRPGLLGTPLGMSYEIADARVADMRAKIWTLTHVTFTGAAILRREKAAYRETWIGLEESF